MSSLPPGSGYEPPPPPPPPPGSVPPPPTSGLPPIPWEAVPRPNAVEALVETFRLFALDPKQAWSRTPGAGGLANPLLYGLVVVTAGYVVSALWSAFLPNPWVRMLPPEMAQKFGTQAAAGAAGLLVQIVVGPLIAVCVLFIGAGILHVSSMIVGALSSSKTGFEGTFRVVAYASTAQIAGVVPIVGGLVALVWGLYLEVLGVVELHRTTTGKSVAAVLIPLAVCCLCCIGVIVLSAGALMNLMGRTR